MFNELLLYKIGVNSGLTYTNGVLIETLDNTSVGLPLM